MIVRRRQLQSWERQLLDQFVAWTHAHLRSHFPAVCSERGPDAVEASIRLGVERARGYGISESPDIVRYINVMFAFHDDFDRDTRMAWMPPILQHTDLTGTQKMDSVASYIEMNCVEGAAGRTA